MNELKNYIEEAEIRVLNNNIRIKLSKDLAKKYDKGFYNNYLLNLEKCYQMLMDLNIKFSQGKERILYIYIVPDDSYSNLLNIPKLFDKGTGGGKPVRCFESDGYKWAYGLSQNILYDEEKEFKKINVYKAENLIHELSHIIHNEFFSKNSFINEGMAEVIPLYILNLEETFKNYKDTLKNLDEENIYSVSELINQEKNGDFGSFSLDENKTCSYRLSYISSFLFVRGCLKLLEKKLNIDKKEALQKFLEMLEKIDYKDEELVNFIAEELSMDSETLLTKKNIQIENLDSIKNNT